MADLSKSDRAILRPYVTEYNNWIAETIERPVREKLHVRPQELVNIFKELQRLSKTLSNSEEHILLVQDKNQIALLKRAIIHFRKQAALRIEERSRLTFNRGIRKSLEAELGPLSKIMASDWFRETVAAEPMRLADYLSVQHAEELISRSDRVILGERAYDEKFRILLAPSLFLPDLSYYRTICELRAVPVSVAYLDIDHFKDFNSKYREPRVDRDVLPRFMSALEAHLFSHGYAYRYGGDEYVALLPNTSLAQASDLFFTFQKQLESLEFFEIEDRLSISVGICEVTEDCALTDHEVEERSAYAKSVAKGKGRNCICVMTGPNYNDEDVQLARRSGE